VFQGTALDKVCVRKSSRNDFRVPGLNRKETLIRNGDEKGAALPPPHVSQGAEVVGLVTEAFREQTLLTKSVTNSKDPQSCRLFS